jgi:hypothetical protein
MNKSKIFSVSDELRSRIAVMIRFRLYERLHNHVNHNLLADMDRGINSKLYEQIFNELYMALHDRMTTETVFEET